MAKLSHTTNDSPTVKRRCCKEGKIFHQSANPIDGRWAVVVVIAAFIGQAILSLQPCAIPILTVEWEKRMGFTPSQVSWATTLVTALGFCTAPVIGALNTKFGCRPVVFAGGILAMVSTLLLSLVKELWQINICSAGIGTAIGLAYQGTIIIVNVYCEKWLGRANGFAQGGVGIGYMVGSPLMALLIDFYTWRGALLILSGLSANVSVVAAVYRPLTWWSYGQTLSKPNSKSGSQMNDCDEHKEPLSEGATMLPDAPIDIKTSSEVDVNDGETEEHLRINHDCHEDNAVISPLVLTKQSESGLQDTVGNNRPDSNEQHQISSIGRSTVNHEIRKDRHSRTRAFIKYILHLFGFSLLWASFKVFLLCLVAVFRGVGYFPSFIYLSSYIVSTGVSELRASFIFTIIGVCSLVGRLTHGFLIDFKIITPINLLGLTSIVAGCSAYIIVLFRSYPAFSVYAVIFGLSSGAMNALTPVVTKKYTAPSELASAYALQNFFLGVFQLIGTYFLGLLFDRTSKYGSCFGFTGALLFASGVICLVIEPLNKRLHRHHSGNQYSQHDQGNAEGF